MCTSKKVGIMLLRESKFNKFLKTNDEITVEDCEIPTSPKWDLLDSTIIDFWLYY